jgi:hypothetical protein
MAPAAYCPRTVLAGSRGRIARSTLIFSSRIDSAARFDGGSIVSRLSV